VSPNNPQCSDEQEKRQLAAKLANRWSYSSKAIFDLLNWLESNNQDWRQPEYILKVIRESGIDLDEWF
jgi:hypothetical protein